MNVGRRNSSITEVESVGNAGLIWIISNMKPRFENLRHQRKNDANVIISTIIRHIWSGKRTGVQPVRLPRFSEPSGRM